MARALDPALVSLEEVICMAALSDCCGSPVERWNDGSVRCSECSKRQ